MTNNREMLMKRIQVCDFVLFDTALFLDTNPEDPTALAHYKKHMGMREAAVSEYVSKYGPVTKGDYDGGPRWRWVDNPWPWQTEEA